MNGRKLGSTPLPIKIYSVMSTLRIFAMGCFGLKAKMEKREFMDTIQTATTIRISGSGYPPVFAFWGLAFIFLKVYSLR